MFGRLGSMFGRVASGGSGGIVPPTQGQILSLIGPPQGRLDPTQDHILSDIYSPPYRGPGELDNYGGETPRMRHEFRTEYHEGPVLRAAIRGKADDICGLEPTVLAGNKDSEESNAAAEFVKDTIRMAPGGWPGLLDSIYTPGSIDGWSVCEKKLRQFVWRGFRMWGLAHVRSLDSVHIRLQLDVYRNVVGIVNALRGLEYYDPSTVILYTHNGMYGNPFGHSDVRPALTASTMIREVYKIWYVALKVYGLPYMVGKGSEKTTRKMMEATLSALRAGGWAALNKDDSIEAINLATGAAFNGFEKMLQVRREDIFYATRGVAQPFMEGKGGNDAHTDTGVQQESSDASERMKAHQLADVINHQLLPWLVGPNFDLDESEMPWVKFGSTDWKLNGTIVDTFTKAKQAGAKISASAFAESTNIPTPLNDDDILETPQEKQARLQAANPQPQPAAAPGQPAALPSPAPPAPQPQASEPATFSDPVERFGLWEYQCPRCGGRLYSGDAKTGTKTRGGAKCVDCGQGSSYIHLTPVRKPSSETATFSAEHGRAGVSAEQLTRVVSELLREVSA